MDSQKKRDFSTFEASRTLKNSIDRVRTIRNRIAILREQNKNVLSCINLQHKKISGIINMKINNLSGAELRTQHRLTQQQSVLQLREKNNSLRRQSKYKINQRRYQVLKHKQEQSQLARKYSTHLDSILKKAIKIQEERKYVKAGQVYATCIGLQRKKFIMDKLKNIENFNRIHKKNYSNQVQSMLDQEQVLKKAQLSLARSLSASKKIRNDLKQTANSLFLMPRRQAAQLWSDQI